MIKKREILRKCSVCGERKEKKELLRIVRTPDGNVLIDEAGKMSGRGTYLCSDIKCFNKAKKTNKLSKDLQTDINPDLYNEIENVLKNNE